MKKTLFLMMLACVMVLAVGCKPDGFVEPQVPSTGNNGNGNDNDKDNSFRETCNLEINVLSEDTVTGFPATRLMAESDDWVMFDIEHDGLEHDSTRSIVFMHKTEPVGYYLYVMKNLVVMAEFTDNPLENFYGGNVIVTACHEDYTHCFVVRDIFGDQEIISETVVDNQSEEQPNLLMAKDDDYYDDYGASIYRTISKHFKEAAQTIEDVFVKYSFGAGQTVAKFWSSVVFAVSLNQIHSYNPDLQEEIQEEIEQDNRYFINLTLKRQKWYSLGNMVYEKLKSGIEIGKKWFSNNEIKHDENTSETISPIFSGPRVVDGKYWMIYEYLRNHPECKLNLSVGNVTENSADLEVTITGFLGDVNDVMTSVGVFKYRNMTTGEVGEAITYNDLRRQITINGLTKLTRYICWVEVQMARVYRSNTVDFITKGVLHTEPAALIFPKSGGSRGMTLLIDRYVVRGFDLDVPNWITKVDKSATSFFLTAGENKKNERIVDHARIFVYLTDGTELLQVVPVIQEMSDNMWDGTKWKFYHSQMGGEFTLEIVSVAQSKAICSAFNYSAVNWKSKITQPSDSTLTIDQSYNVVTEETNITNGCTFYLERKSEVDVHATINIYVNVNGTDAMQQIQCDGTLISQ